MNQEELLAIARQELAQESSVPNFSPEQHSTFLEIARRELAQEDPMSFGSVWDVAKKAIYDIPSIPGQLYDAAKPIVRSGLATAGNVVGIDPATTYSYLGANPNQYGQDLENSVRTIGKGAAATAGAGVGALTGPFAPAAVPVLSSAAMKGFDWLNQAIGSDAPTTAKQDLNDLVYNSVQGGAIAGGAKAAGKVANAASSALGKVSDAAESASNAVKEKTLGVGYGDKKTSLGRAPVYLDESGNVVPKGQAADIEAPIQKQVQLLDNTGFFQRARQSGQDPSSIAAQLAKEQAATGASIQNLIGEADEALSGQVGKITPKFPKATAYLNRLGEESPSTQRSLLPVMEEIKNDYNTVARIGVDPKTGQPAAMPLAPLEKINSVKRGLNEKANFWNSNKDTAKANLYRSAYQDLQSLERQVFDSALPSKKGQFAAANDLYAAQSTFGKTINKSLAAEGAGKGFWGTFGSIAARPQGSFPVIGAGALAGLVTGNPFVGAAAFGLGNAAYKALSKTKPLSIMDAYSQVGNLAGQASPLVSALGGKIANAATPAAQLSRMSQAASDSVKTQLDNQQSNVGQLAQALLAQNSVPQAIAKPSTVPPISSDGMADQSPNMKIDPALIEAQIKVESSGNPNAVGPNTKYGRAKGLMQLIDSTGKELMDRLGLEGDYDPFNPELNRTLGTAYMSQLVDKYGNPDLALAAYNWGMGNLDRLMRKVGSTQFSDLRPYLPEETRNYVEKINKLRNQQVVA